LSQYRMSQGCVAPARDVKTEQNGKVVFLWRARSMYCTYLISAAWAGGTQD
jgi:hypothetical protein